MKTIKSIFRLYGIEKALVKNDQRVEIIIVKRSKNIDMNRWINLINSLKYEYRKEVDFLLENDAKEIYRDFSEFTLVEVSSND